MIETTNKHRVRLGGYVFSALWLFACTGVVALCAWLVFEESRRVQSLQVIEDFLQTDPKLKVVEERSRLMEDLADIQQRAALPLPAKAPIAFEHLQKRFELVVGQYGDEARQLANSFAALSNTEPVEIPAVSFAGFDRHPHTLVFTEARSKREPLYSFRLEYGAGAFPSEDFRDLRWGDVVAGWQIRGATTHTVRGVVIKRNETDRKGRVKIMREKMPDYEIYRLSLVRKGAPTTILTIPRSERDAERARISGFEFSSTLPGETSVAEISLVGVGKEPVNFVVKAGSEFLALEKTYRVLSVQPTTLRLEEVGGAREVVWELGHRYEQLQDD
jgi:hypothetical protein